MKSYFFNAVSTADLASHPSGYDREYDADDHAAFFSPMFSEAGVFAGTDSGACLVQVHSGATLSVAAGAVYIRGRMAIFDGTETIQADRDCKIAVRMDKSMTVRDFQLVAVDELTRTEDVYDLELARVTLQAVTGGHEARVTDTRTFLSYMGQPAYYPPDSSDLPYALWLYTLGFPMSPEQQAAVEGNPSLMEIYGASKTGRYQVDFTAADWVEEMGEHTLTIPQSIHHLSGTALVCKALAQTAAGLVTNAWCALETYATLAEDGAVVLHVSGGSAYSGRAVLTTS